MAPRTSRGLQERAWDAPTKGLEWIRFDLCDHVGPHGGVRPFHQKSTRLTQSILGPYAVQIWSRYARNFEPTKLSNPPRGGAGRVRTLAITTHPHNGLPRGNKANIERLFVRKALGMGPRPYRLPTVGCTDYELMSCSLNTFVVRCMERTANEWTHLRQTPEQSIHRCQRPSLQKGVPPKSVIRDRSIHICGTGVPRSSAPPLGPQ